MAGSSAQLARARARDQLGTIPVITHQHESLPTAPSLLSDIETKLPTLSPAGHEHLPLPASMPDTSLFPRHEDRSQTQKKQRKGRKTEKRSSKTLDEGPRKVPSRSTVPETPVEEPDPTNDDWMYEMSFPATGEDWSEDNRVDPPPHEGQNEMQQDADLYARMIFHEKVAYVARIDERTWALEGVKGGITQVGQFNHVALYEGVDVASKAFNSASCECCDGKMVLSCAHMSVVMDHIHSFQSELVLSARLNPTTVQFAAHLHGRRAWFSVLSTKSNIVAASQDGKRCIVSLLNAHSWTCSASHCPKGTQAATACVHRQRAHAFWMESVGLDVEEDDAHDGLVEEEDDDLEDIAKNVDSVQAHVQGRPCSHLPVPAPPFCRLSSEPFASPVIHGDRLPSVLPIGDHARCDCGRASRIDAALRLRSCTVYYSTGSFAKLIQTQECDCRSGPERRSIGPDLSEYGLFNWNNSVIVAHEVFNAYTSQLCSSPTPFTAFCSTTQHTYEQYAPGKADKFLARSTFVKLYFAFVDLQRLEVSFSCPRCGPTPATVIADGVVLAFSASLKHSSLQPPTTTGSEINHHARPGSIVPFLSTSGARSAAHRFASCSDNTTAEQADAIQEFKAAIDGSKKLPPVMQLWARTLQQLMLDMAMSASIDSELKKLLQHMIVQFAASDGILQLCRPLCQPLLLELGRSDLSQSNAHLLRVSTTLARHCPFLGNVFVLCAHNVNTRGPNQEPLLGSLRRLAAATEKSIQHQMTLLAPRETPPSASCDSSISETPGNYTQKGALYGSPKCRTRPTYPKLDEGQGGKSTERKAIKEGEAESEQVCRKFYEEYVKRKRTGGLMALWCTHCICVGFHVIPQAEGRNDVFSALFSHWPEAPSVVVYDFACQLGPYSLRREPAFFRDTLFVVDQMHEKGHSNCSAASRLSTYMRNDPDLQHIYSSAAECGNSGLTRIKKTVSYCNQEHAVALVRVFLSVWNRRRRLAVEKASLG